MEYCKCNKEKEIAELQANQKLNIEEVRSIRTEMQDLKNIYKLIYELTSNFSVLNETMNHTRDDVKTIKEDLEVIKGEPRNRENHFIKVGVGAIITIVLAAIFKLIMQ